jgi:translation initiation factor 2B subunit (eIF-2B alpha/beta/delta family)
MAAISNVVNILLFHIKQISGKVSTFDKLKELFYYEVILLKKRTNEDLMRMKKIVQEHVESKIIFTHSYSSTIIEAMTMSHPRRVIVTESRPLMEGKKTAEQLLENGILVTLITEAETGLFIKDAELILVGADSILSDGTIINKVGTYPIALIAHIHKIPFYVVCDTLKFNPFANSKNVKLESRISDEILRSQKKNITVQNIVFDITPPDLVKGVITENGVLQPSEISEKMQMLRKIYNDSGRLL